MTDHETANPGYCVNGDVIVHGVYPVKRVKLDFSKICCNRSLETRQKIEINHLVQVQNQSNLHQVSDKFLSTLTEVTGVSTFSRVVPTAQHRLVEAV